MVTSQQAAAPIASREEAEGYVAMICFKHGPPRRVGVELEWTVHHLDNPARPLDAACLIGALGPHAPRTLVPDSPHLCLPCGSRVTVEPGGQLEISTPPASSVTGLLRAVGDDVAALDMLLDEARLVRGQQGSDAHRSPRRLLEVPRYAAMQGVFDRVGPHGSRMMCSTASMQVCLDAGTAEYAPTRWRALHAIGPALVALFANSPQQDGRDTGWASSRLRSTLGTCPPVTHPPMHTENPTASWADLAMSAPVLCMRRDGGCWDAPPDLTFGGWLAGRHDVAPTYDDLDYHLSTLFPPVRPRGYLEVRYLDTQPDATWHDPLLLVAALMSEPSTVDAALDAAAVAEHRWLQAARDGLDDPRSLEAATALVEVGAAAMPGLEVCPDTAGDTVDRLHSRIAEHSMRRHYA